MIQDFALELSILLLGTVEDKLRWIFKLYDLNKVNWNTIYPYPKLIRIMNPIYLLNFNCEAQVQSQIQVLNPGPKSKGTKTEADTIILRTTHPTPPHPQ